MRRNDFFFERGELIHVSKRSNNNSIIVMCTHKIPAKVGLKLDYTNVQYWI